MSEHAPKKEDSMCAQAAGAVCQEAGRELALRELQRAPYALLRLAGGLQKRTVRKPGFAGGRLQ